MMKTTVVNNMWYISLICRDIKLENVLLARDGHCKLCDFGVSQLGILNGVKTRTCIGTRVYMAPEVIVTVYCKCDYFVFCTEVFTFVLMFLF